ncbi:hypothetical protein OEZ85_010209 [Tetradesmus obliquus]|uniref:EamA domain-containing protein n=1 Tax=Tetradesmus obliquus TaxID=3088 RepID=A0ABY8TLL1_TETOB|nr:hypothetical protein OEZ85_010209 [Tetradesmus obliquus]
MSAVYGRLHTKVLGSGFVLLTTVLWIAASFLAQFLVRPDATGSTPQLPSALLVFICTSLFSIYIPIIALKHACCGSYRAQAPAVQQCESPWLSSTARSAIKVAPVWFAAQYAFTLSLAHTSVTSNTILSSSSCMFTLLAAAALLRERVTAAKLASVAAVMAGTALVTLADGAAAGDASQGQLLGDALCVLSALLYSGYTVALQAQLRHDSPEAPALFFGVIGCMTAAVGLPLLGCGQLLGWLDVRQLQPQALALAGINGLMDYVLADYTWARAVLLLGPTVATLGMTVQIPLATAADVVLSWTGLGHPHWMDSRRATLLTAAGTVAILAGVFGINCSGGSDAGSDAGGSSGGWQAGEQAGHIAADGGLQERLLQAGDGEGQQQHSEGAVQSVSA